MTPARHRAARLDPNVRREMIMHAAVQVFEQRDPSEVTFEEIAAAAGVSRALVYNYFGDRGGLLAAIYLATMDALITELAAEDQPSRPPDERLRALLRGCLAFARDHAAEWRLLRVSGSIPHPAIVAARYRYVERLAGKWGHRAEARIVACGLIALLEAASFEWLQGQGVDIDQLSEVLADLVAHGLDGLTRHGIAP